MGLGGVPSNRMDKLEKQNGVKLRLVAVWKNEDHLETFVLRGLPKPDDDTRLSLSLKSTEFRIAPSFEAIKAAVDAARVRVRFDEQLRVDDEEERALKRRRQAVEIGLAELNLQKSKELLRLLPKESLSLELEERAFSLHKAKQGLALELEERAFALHKAKQELGLEPPRLCPTPPTCVGTEPDDDTWKGDEAKSLLDIIHAWKLDHHGRYPKSARDLQLSEELVAFVASVPQCIDVGVDLLKRKHKRAPRGSAEANEESEDE